MGGSGLGYRSVAAGLLVAILLAGVAACGDDGDPSSSAGSDAGSDAGWRFVDDRGVEISLAERPQRVVAYVGTAAVLWDFGVRPIGVFGPQRREDGTPEPAAGRVDLDAVESVGDTWDGVNLEALAALDPDLVISGGVDSAWVIGEQIADVEKIAPVAVVEVYGAPASTILGNYERLAVALGADVGSDELVAARADYDDAAAALSDAAAAKPGLTVLATFADTDGLYAAKPKDFPDLLEFQRLGVELVEPGGSEDYWELLSWEEAGRYPADLLIHDIRSYSLQPDVLDVEQPTWAALPAVEAGQVGAWSAEAVLSYQGFAEAMRALAAEIEAADASVV